jgi:hypothetical protein
MAEARIALARIYVRRKEPVLADDAYARAMVDLPDDSTMLGAFIAYQLARGRETMALDAARRFTRENPLSRDGWRQRGKLCVRLADAGCVAESFNALDQIPGGAKVRHALEVEWRARGGIMPKRADAVAAGQAPSSCGRTGRPC